MKRKTRICIVCIFTACLLVLLFVFSPKTLDLERLHRIAYVEYKDKLYLLSDWDIDAGLEELRITRTLRKHVGRSKKEDKHFEILLQIEDRSEIKLLTLVLGKKNYAYDNKWLYKIENSTLLYNSLRKQIEQIETMILRPSFVPQKWREEEIRISESGTEIRFLDEYTRVCKFQYTNLSIEDQLNMCIQNGEYFLSEDENFCFFPPDGPQDNATLVWRDLETQLIFILSAPLSQDELEKIARSM